ncbi:MAG: tagaturonate epimerase family protein [Clostridiales bacterium]|nr:tagaturonate epimerase family protein [Clostridiales bacterium]
MSIDFVLPDGARVYPDSVSEVQDGGLAMARHNGRDIVVTAGAVKDAFGGGELTRANAAALRSLLPFTAPAPILSNPRTIGLGDRLGVATPGHIRAVADYDVFPVFAQQSARELSLTNRSFEDVLDAATFAVFREGYRRGYGADADHLKRPEDITAAIGLGYTMITLDCSDHIRPGSGDDPESCRAVYGDAIEFAARIYHDYIAPAGGKVDFELSIDETDTPTTPAQHLYVAESLAARGVRPATVAPRFCGEFQKGIDYIGDISQFERELAAHREIAERFGYKLSIHSGSDKFAVFRSVGRLTRGRFHLKTAGTNWLEAVRVVAAADPALFREVYAFALESFADARRFYHVKAAPESAPDISGVPDSDLPSVLDDDDARQVVHITYGHILTAPQFRSRLYRLWAEHAEDYAERLAEHIGAHLKNLFYSSNGDHANLR